MFSKLDKVISMVPFIGPIYAHRVWSDRITKFTGKEAGFFTNVRLTEAEMLKLKQSMDPSKVAEAKTQRGELNAINTIRKYQVIGVVTTLVTPLALVYFGVGGNARQQVINKVGVTFALALCALVGSLYGAFGAFSFSDFWSNRGQIQELKNVKAAQAKPQA